MPGPGPPGSRVTCLATNKTASTPAETCTIRDQPSMLARGPPFIPPLRGAPPMSAGPDPRSSNAQVIEQERRRLSQRLDEVARLCEGTLPASAFYGELLQR